MTFILKWAGVLGTIAIIILAMSSHVLHKHYNTEQLASINTAGYIQLVHSVALLVLGLHNNHTKQISLVIKCMLAGVCCFSFSIYLLVFNNLWEIAFINKLWPITPIGGILLILSWFLIVLNAKYIIKIEN